MQCFPLRTLLKGKRNYQASDLIKVLVGGLAEKMTSGRYSRDSMNGGLRDRVGPWLPRLGGHVILDSHDERK